MPRTTAPSTNPRILAGYAPYGGAKTEQGTTSFSKIGGSASTTEERRQLLLDDPYTHDVQPEQVTCRRCSKTVRLQKGKQYHLAHWLDHRWRCDRTETDPQPRARCRTLAERKACLEADPDAKIVEPERVVCARCNKEPIDNPKPSPPVHPQFFRARASTIETITSTSRSNASTPHPSDSSDDAEEPPRTLEPRPMDLPYHHHQHHHHHHHHHHQQQQQQQQQHHHHHHPRTMTNGPQHYQAPSSSSSSASTLYTSRSVSPLSPPPPLSFSTVTSASTSVTSSPMTSPSFRRKPSLFSNPRHLPLPLPECPPLPPQPQPPVLGLSRLTLEKDYRDDEQRGGDKYKAALGLSFSSPPSRFPSPTSPSSDLGTSSSSSSSFRNSSHQYLPPYPERTPIILPMPERCCIGQTLKISSHNLVNNKPVFFELLTKPAKPIYIKALHASE
ncbi:hypothetical protein Clacol_005794 [Clathrus columnatus]|uniref:Uncharacterized protein n=1 Tax=Clathrus columnatus TaxID=1419009 RepID=A0AAV5AHY6_9AGAM|nr:hypothetical protein Clacol_005794 [Clathrus columnatus]